MADTYLIQKTTLDDIGDAIRAKTGGSALLSPTDMPEAISSISGGGSSVLPATPKYFAFEIADQVTKLAALRKAGTLMIAHITDSHIYTSSNNRQYFDAQAAAMNAICKAIPPDLVIHGGDMSNGSEAKSTTLEIADHVTKAMREIGGDNTLILIGNHDGNTVQSDSANNEANRITEAEMLQKYRYWDDGFTYAEGNYQGGNFYGYKDYSCGIRVIRLHSYIEAIGDRTCDGGMGGNWGYYADEVTWFTNVALNTDNDILIVCHQTLSPVLQGYAESSDIPHRGTQMQQALDAWLTANANHKCIGVLHGHVHWDFTHVGKGSFTVIDHSTKTQISRTGSYGNFYEYGQGLSNYLTTMPTADATPVSSYRDVPVGAVVPGRTVSTATQALWTAVVIDPANSQIDFVRFGAGNDQSINYADTSVHVTGVTMSESSGTLTEGQTKTLTATVAPANASNKSVTWSSSDNSVATVSGGLVTAVSEGTATITVTTVDGGFTDTFALTVQAVPKINQIPLSTDASGNPYNGGQGYKDNYRLNSSGAETAATGFDVVGFIPCSKGQKLTFVDMDVPATNYTGYNSCYIAVYDSSKTCIKSGYSKDWFGTSQNAGTKDSSNNIVTLTMNYGINTSIDNMAFVRVSAIGIDGNSAIYVE